MCITDCYEDDTEKPFVVVKERATVFRTLDGDMLIIYCSNTTRKIPQFRVFIGNVLPLSS